MYEMILLVLDYCVALRDKPSTHALAVDHPGPGATYTATLIHVEVPVDLTQYYLGIDKAVL